MRQPPSFKPDHVCQMVKALYGLRQAPRAWHTRLGAALRAHGLYPPRLILSCSCFVGLRLLCTSFVYVDDIILVSFSIPVAYRLI
jgi:hypothetical protein